MSSLRVRALRGATAVPEDSPGAIGSRVRELLEVILERNELQIDDLISVIFTATADLSSAFPATAAREIGFGVVPLICASEIPVEGAMKRCVRVMLHVEMPSNRDPHHVYLHEARSLRDDLPA
ncbi:MAG: chorismate mutase [Actinobacteria bacterium]|nr:chorismate mutase [Actinomycetota bacterium]